MNSLKSDSPIIAVLCDFGTSRVHSETQTVGMTGTEGYISPELLNGEPDYGVSSDVSFYNIVIC